MKVKWDESFLDLSISAFTQSAALVLFIVLLHYTLPIQTLLHKRRSLGSLVRVFVAQTSTASGRELTPQTMRLACSKDGRLFYQSERRRAESLSAEARPTPSHLSVASGARQFFVPRVPMHREKVGDMQLTSKAMRSTY